MGSNYLVQDLAIIGIAAMVVTWLFSILKMPMLLGYILAGVLVSPVLGLIHESADIAQMGEIGVMFMMFFIGMEFNFERLKEVAAVSVLGIVAQALVLVLSGLAMAAFLGLSATNGVFLGAILSMSSTIVLVDLLAQRRELSKPFAQIAVGILILEDLFAIMLIVALSTVGDGIRLDISGIATRCLTMSAFVVSIFVAGKLCAPWVIRKIALPRSPQVLTMFVFCFILALGELASAVDLSTSLGAFLAGSILSGTAISARIENITNPFRNLFVALFFVSVGTMASPAKIAGALPAIVAMSLLVIVLKVAACWIGTVAGGANPRDAYLASVNKAQVGEFGFVIAGIGINRGVLDSSVFAIVMGVPLDEAVNVGSLMGTKLVFNEFIAYLDLTALKPILSAKSIIVATFALCGFANLGSIAIQIGGIGELAPNRRKDLAKLGVKALICGTLASYLSACIAGILL